MFKSYRIGSLLGFPIEVNVSFLILLGVVLLWLGGLTGLFIVLCAFASVLLHELGHALVARHLGVPVPGIELHFFGGAAKMGAQPRSAGDEIAIAAAGPAVSFALAGLGVLGGSLLGSWFLLMLGWINLIIGGFNLMPALPMDGGRIFRALLTRRYSFTRSTEIAVKVARGFAIVLAVAGIAAGHFFLPLLAVVLWFMGSAELRLARFGGYGGRPSIPEVEVLPRGYRTSPDAPGPRPFGFHRGPRRGGFVIRREGGRLYVDLVD